MSERDKFLTEAMGERVVTVTGATVRYVGWTGLPLTDFSTWEGFGKLFTWCTGQYQPWWDGFSSEFESDFPMILIHPNRFADAIYEYLKEVRGDEK